MCELYALSSRLKTQAASLSLFVRFLFFWTALSWASYTLAGERMPWMSVHIAVPMILATAWIVGKFIEGTDWRMLRRGGWLVFVHAPVGWAALTQTISPWLASYGARPLGRSERKCRSKTCRSKRRYFRAGSAFQIRAPLGPV